MLSTGIELFSQVVANQVFSSHMSLTSVFGMGTGVTSSLFTPILIFWKLISQNKARNSNKQENLIHTNQKEKPSTD